MFTPLHEGYRDFLAAIKLLATAMEEQEEDEEEDANQDIANGISDVDSLCKILGRAKKAAEIRKPVLARSVGPV